MERTIRMVYDGVSLRPLEPVELELDRSYLVRIDEVSPRSAAEDAWTELSALAGTIDAPSDWAREHDHYLYGSPKHGVRNRK